MINDEEFEKNTHVAIIRIILLKRELKVLWHKRISMSMR